jgi:hypothetical protein
MKNRILALVTLTWLATASATAGDVYIVAQPSLTLSADEVRDAFLGDKQMAGGTRIVPLDNAAQQKDFLERVLKLDPAKYNAIWVKKGFRDGLNAPPVKNSDAEVSAIVRGTPGAISYVANPPKDLKVLGKY